MTSILNMLFFKDFNNFFRKAPKILKSALHEVGRDGATTARQFMKQ